MNNSEAKKPGKRNVVLPTPGEEGVKVGKYKRSGLLVDQTLKYNYPNKNSDTQLDLFEMLEDSTIRDIDATEIERTKIVEGIQLSPGEQKIVDSLCKLLHYKSQNNSPTDSNYYTGNLKYDSIEYGGRKTPAPKLAFTLYELTKEYKGGEAISGKDVENVRNILTELNQRYFLINYIETVRTQSGGRIEKKIEDFGKLIHIYKLSQIEYSRENVELNKLEENIIALNPIFREHIDSKFILYPDDIIKRTAIAYGSHNISEITIRLREFLMRELSKKRYSPEITIDKLYYQLAEKWMKEGRKKKVREYTDKALETMKILGILLSWEVVTGSKGQPKIIFSINKNWG